VLQDHRLVYQVIECKTELLHRILGL